MKWLFQSTAIILTGILNNSQDLTVYIPLSKPLIRVNTVGSKFLCLQCCKRPEIWFWSHSFFPLYGFCFFHSSKDPVPPSLVRRALVSVQLKQLCVNVEFLRMGGDPILSICTVLAKNQAAGCNFQREEKMEAVFCLLKSVTVVWTLWLAFPKSRQGGVLPLCLTSYHKWVGRTWPVYIRRHEM